MMAFILAITLCVACSPAPGSQAATLAPSATLETMATGTETQPSPPTTTVTETQKPAPSPTPTLIRADWCVPSSTVPSGWSYLDNGKVRVGVDLYYGASIGLISAGGENIIDTDDNGRYISQSFYGTAAAHRGKWGNMPWDYNPVQGGASDGTPSRVTEFCNDGLTMYAKTIPQDWGNQGETRTVMEQWISLREELVEIHYRFEYLEDWVNEPFTHETPAIYVRRDLENLVYYDGNLPWKMEPVTHYQPLRLETSGNDYLSFTESWLAYVDANDWGIGFYKKGEKDVTCFRVGEIGEKSATSYFAFLDTRALVPGMVHEYTIYGRIGTLDQLRATFYELQEEGK
jgi:hypothetical protein